MNEHEPWSEQMQANILRLQVIYGALILGAGSFAVVAAAISPAGGNAGQFDAMLFRLIWALLFVSMLVGVVGARAIFPRAAARQIGSPDASDEAHFNPYFIMTIFTGAMLEGTSLFGGITLLLGGEKIDLALALIPLAVMLPFFPTRRGFEKFVDRATGRERKDEGLSAPSRDFRQFR